MQIILLEKVINVGQLGDVVKVKDGYARNFLIPKGKARRATAGAMAEFEARRAELEKAEAAKFSAASAVAEKMSGLEVSIASKAGVDGRLFGSVTNADIAESLKASGFEVAKNQIKIVDGAIKTVGEYAVQVTLFTDVVSSVTWKVVAV